MSNPSEAHMGAAKHLLRCLAGSIDFNITYRKGGFNLTTFSDVNWCSNPDNGKSTSSYVVIMCNKPVSFKVGIQGLTAQSTMEAELVAAALRMKEAVYCVGMMGELGFKESPTVSLLSLPPVDSQLYCSFLHSMQSSAVDHLQDHHLPNTRKAANCCPCPPVRPHVKDVTTIYLCVLSTSCFLFPLSLIHI